MLTLSEIWIYPIKSMGGIRLLKGRVMPKGLLNDRRFMVVDGNNSFISQRTQPRLALFSVALSEEMISITAGEETLSFSIEDFREGAPLDCVVQDDQVKTRTGPRGYDEWLANQLQTTCRLVFFPEDGVRKVNPEYAFNNEEVSLADGFPYLLIGQSSLDELNSRLDSAMPMNRFRPNLVVANAQPFEEDIWKQITIGTISFAVVKGCSRCTTTTVNQETGVAGKEPLRTLSTYRVVDSKVRFGQNLMALSGGWVQEGDEVTIQSRKS